MSDPKDYAPMWLDGGGEPTFDQIDGFLYQHFNARAVYIDPPASPSSGPDLRCLTCGAVVIDALAGSCHECGAVDRHIGSQWLRMPDEQRPLHHEGLDIAYLSDGRPACPRCRMPLDGKDALEKFRPARKPVTGPKSEE